MALLKRNRKKRVVKPTAKEQKEVTSRLQLTYSQMFEPPYGYIKMLRGMTAIERKKFMRMQKNGPDKLKKAYKLKKIYGGK